MAKVGLKHLSFAPYTTAGSGAEPTYGTHITDATMKAISANITWDHSDAKLYGDNVLCERDNAVTGGSITIGVTDISGTTMAAIACVKAVGTEGKLVTVDKIAPYVGVGYVTSKVVNGSKKYVGNWIYKAQFGLDSENNSTRQESTEFNTPELTGIIIGETIDTSGDVSFKAEQEFDSEAAAISFVDGF